MPHKHRYTIADDDAVEVLVDKLTSHGLHQQRREKLMKALEDASRHYSTTPDTHRQRLYPLPAGNTATPSEFQNTLNQFSDLGGRIMDGLSFLEIPHSTTADGRKP